MSDEGMREQERRAERQIIIDEMRQQRRLEEERKAVMKEPLRAIYDVFDLAHATMDTFTVYDFPIIEDTWDLEILVTKAEALVRRLSTMEAVVGHLLALRDNGPSEKYQALMATPKTLYTDEPE